MHQTTAIRDGARHRPLGLLSADLSFSLTKGMAECEPPKTTLPVPCGRKKKNDWCNIRTSITLVLLNNVPLAKVMLVAGHKRITSTQICLQTAQKLCLRTARSKIKANEPRNSLIFGIFAQSAFGYQIWKLITLPTALIFCESKAIDAAVVCVALYVRRQPIERPIPN